MPKKSSLQEFPWVDASEAAERLGYTTQGVVKMCQRGVFPGARKANPSKTTSAWLIPTAELEAHIEGKAREKKKRAQAVEA